MEELINFSQVTLVKGQRLIFNFVGVDDEMKETLSKFQLEVNSYLETPIEQLAPNTEGAEDLFAAFCAFMQDNDLVETTDDEDDDDFYPVLLSDVMRVNLNSTTALFFATVTALEIDFDDEDVEDYDDDAYGDQAGEGDGTDQWD